MLVSTAVGLSVGLVTPHARNEAGTRTTKPLITPKPPELNVDKVVELRAEEAAFRPSFAESDIVHRKWKASICFLIVNWLLYRIVVDCSGQTSQLLVPGCSKGTVLLTAHDLVTSGHTGMTYYV